MHVWFDALESRSHVIRHRADSRNDYSSAVPNTHPRGKIDMEVLERRIRTRDIYDEVHSPFASAARSPSGPSNSHVETLVYSVATRRRPMGTARHSAQHAQANERFVERWRITARQRRIRRRLSKCRVYRARQ